MSEQNELRERAVASEAPKEEENAELVANAEDNEVKYEDKHCILTKTHLIIKTYYFPFATSKTIELSDLKDVIRVHRSEFDSILAIKNWGTGLSNVWWALGKRDTTKDVVVFLHSQDSGCGFSLERPEEFHAALYKLNPRVC